MERVDALTILACDLNPRACLETERGCVEDQPQHLRRVPMRRKFEACLRLVEDNRAALRVFETGSNQAFVPSPVSVSG